MALDIASQVRGAGGAAGAAHEGNAGQTGRAQQLPANRGAPGRPADSPGHLHRAGASSGTILWAFCMSGLQLS